MSHGACPACHGAIPAGAVRCPSCGRPTALAAPTPAMPALPSVSRHDVRGAAYSATSVGLRVLSVMSAAGGMMVGSFLGLAGGLEHGLVPGVIAGLAGLTVSGFAWYAGGHLSREADDANRVGREMQVLKLAGSSGGVLFVTDVARSLGISLADADRTLSGMVDGTRVVAEVTDDGLLRFEFRELRVRGPRVEARVVDDTAALAAEQAAAEAERTRARQDGA